MKLTNLNLPSLAVALALLAAAPALASNISGEDGSENMNSEEGSGLSSIGTALFGETTTYACRALGMHGGPLLHKQPEKALLLKRNSFGEVVAYAFGQPISMPGETAKARVTVNASRNIHTVRPGAATIHQSDDRLSGARVTQIREFGKADGPVELLIDERLLKGEKARVVHQWNYLLDSNGKYVEYECRPSQVDYK